MNKLERNMESIELDLRTWGQINADEIKGYPMQELQLLCDRLSLMRARLKKIGWNENNG